MVIEFGVAKTGRYDIEESDETTEIIERPMGGQTVVYCSGIRNGRKSKILSSVIANKVLEKTAESFKDSSAIKYVSDQINREYAGEVCGNFCMFSADFETKTIVVSRCTNLPVFYYQHSQFNVWDTKTQQIGSGKGIHPVITEIPIISAYKTVKTFGGVCFPAHIDRDSLSVLSVLGEIDSACGFKTAELADRTKLEQLGKLHPILDTMHIITDSDAHYLENMRDAENFLEAEDNTPEAVLKALD